ncbi:hypothetical protein IJM86_00470 [bacterium]|nr:hypothetical protein [bacterium]
MNKEKLKVQNNPEKKHQQTETQEYQSLTIDSTLATTETRIQVRGESSELENEIREKTETEKLLSGTKTEEKLLNIVNYPEFSSL